MLYGPERRGCFWRPAGMSCKDFRAATVNADGKAIPMTTAAASQAILGQDKHNTAAADKMREFYTQQTADLVYQLYRRDFDAFGYKRMVVESNSNTSIASAAAAPAR